MSQRLASLCAYATALFAISSYSLPAQAAELPQIKISEKNSVPACVTPGRLMSYVKSRNEKLDKNFETIATEYMRHGEDLSLRWDYAFFQMLLETDTLRFTGDVDLKQNNFAGLGATGRGAKGESFKTVSDGVRAHLQHVLMYAGEKIENPVAERTKNIQEWNVLTSWQQTIKVPMTYTHLAKKWAPTSRSYTRDVEKLAGLFFDGACKADDPHPEMVAEARKGRTGTKAADAAAPKGKGAELAKHALDDARTTGGARSALGASDVEAPVETAVAAASLDGVKILNAEPAEETAVAAVSEAATSATEATSASATPSPSTEAASHEAAKSTAKSEAITPAKIETAALAAPALGQAEKPDAASTAAAPAPAAKEDACRVFTASYGGAKSIIIKAVADGSTNYTVLDVNDGAEKREAEAYIGAYARGGETVGEFSNQEKALEKAFELCPEG